MPKVASVGIPRLDLVIPVYNEAHVLETTVTRLLDAAASWRDFAWRILIVDNGSRDGTDAVGRRIAEGRSEVRFHRLDMKGRGHAIRWAWTETDSEYSLYMDVDLSTDLSAVPRAFAELLSGADIVTGSRFHPHSRVTRSFKRHLFSYAYRCMVKAVFWSRRFPDAQCGFKGVRVEKARALLPLVRNNHWFFDTELLLLAEYAGLTVRSIPVTWIEDADSRVNIPQYVVENLKGLARLRFTIFSLRDRVAR